MEHLTNTNETTSFQFRPGIWINDLVISSILVVVSLYLLVALLYHQIKVEKPRKEGFLQLTLEKRYGVLSKYTCILIGVASLIRHVNSVALLAMEGIAVLSNSSMLQINSVETICDVVPPIGIFFFSVGSGFVYLFLWFRQRVFYVHSSLKVLYNKCVRIFSLAVIFLWVLGWISLVIAYFVEVRYGFNRDIGCEFEEGTLMPYGQIIVVWSILSILMQIALLGLFINPLLKRSLWRDQQNQQNVRSSDHLMKRVKKAIILASICLGSDIVSVIVITLIYVENTNSAIFLYSVNLVINHLVTIACFDYWKNLLWPWKTQCRGMNFNKFNFDKTSLSGSVLPPQPQTKETNVSNHGFTEEGLSSCKE